MSRAIPLIVTLLAASAVPTPRLDAGNGSNYIHLINGIDEFVMSPPPAGAFTGVWRCFPEDMLHAPTLSLLGPTAGSYATKVTALHLNVTASGGSTIRFPTIALSSSLGKCRFLTTAGTPNYGVASVAGLGPVVVGPLTGNAGPVTVNLLAGIAGTSLASPFPAPNIPITVTLCLTDVLGQVIGVPEDESLVLWVQDDPNQFGPGTRQYWTRSIDERNLCSSYSSWIDASGTMQHRPPNEEWGIGFGTLDASLSTAIHSLGPGPAGNNVHDAAQGFSPGFDAGSGTRTISITGTGGTGPGAASIGNEFLGFNVYDENRSSFRLVCANFMGIDASGSGTCNTRSPSFVSIPTGGPGGPIFSVSIPEMPRSVGKSDALTTVFHTDPYLIASTNHQTIAGGNNFPYLPLPAANGGSNAGGNVGGFTIPLPLSSMLPGLQIFFWSLNVDPTNSFLDPTARGGHKLTNGYPVLFFP